METWIATQLPKFLTLNKITWEKSEETKLVEQLAFYIYTMVYNICAVVATNSKVYDPALKEVKPRHLQQSLTYIQKKCYPLSITMEQKGGSSYHFDAEYLGKETGAYKADAGKNILALDFENKIARPEISGGAPGVITFTEISYTIINTSERKDLFPNDDIKTILSDFQVKIGRHSLQILKKILKMHFNCLMIDLYAHQPLTLVKLHKMVALKRHSVFL